MKMIWNLFIIFIYFFEFQILFGKNFRKINFQYKFDIFNKNVHYDEGFLKINISTIKNNFLCDFQTINRYYINSICRSFNYDSFISFNIPIISPKKDEKCYLLKKDKNCCSLYEFLTFYNFFFYS